MVFKIWKKSEWSSSRTLRKNENVWCEFDDHFSKHHGRKKIFKYFLLGYIVLTPYIPVKIGLRPFFLSKRRLFSRKGIFSQNIWPVHSSDLERAVRADAVRTIMFLLTPTHTQTDTHTKTNVRAQTTNNLQHKDHDVDDVVVKRKLSILLHFCSVIFSFWPFVHAILPSFCKK